MCPHYEAKHNNLFIVGLPPLESELLKVQLAVYWVSSAVHRVSNRSAQTVTGCTKGCSHSPCTVQEVCVVVSIDKEVIAYLVVQHRMAVLEVI